MNSFLYKQEKSEVFKFLLNNIFFINNNRANDKDIELFITPECNLKCSYCYLNNNGDELYPKNIRDYQNIITNMDILLEYFKINNYHIKCLDLFSGEIWGSNLGISILKKLFDFYSTYKLSNSIMIPSNMSFITSNNVDIIQGLIDKFKAIGIKLIFSASIDGKYLDNIIRSRKDSQEYSDEFYTKVFEFCQKNNFGLHPMLSAESIKYWIENDQWFEKIVNNYNLSIMTLEVRNDNWDNKSIDYFLKYLDYKFNQFKNKSVDEIYNFLYSNKSPIYNLYSPLRLERHTGINCSIQRTLMIRLGDLAIIPCHRLAYPSLIFGKFIVENNKIVDIEANNAELATLVYSVNPECGFPSCDICKYKYLCIKGCLGTQYETSYDVLLPCESVCNLEKAKIDFLIKKYKDLGLFEYMAQNNLQVELLDIIKFMDI